MALLIWSIILSSFFTILILSYVIYSQSLIKKDREDLNDPQMPQFFSELITAYMDPALSPLQFSNSDGHRVSNFSDISDDQITPLLSHAWVQSMIVLQVMYSFLWRQGMGFPQKTGNWTTNLSLHFCLFMYIFSMKASLCVQAKSVNWQNYGIVQVFLYVAIHF